MILGHAKLGCMTHYEYWDEPPTNSLQQVGSIQQDMLIFQVPAHSVLRQERR